VAVEWRAPYSASSITSRSKADMSWSK